MKVQQSWLMIMVGVLLVGAGLLTRDLHDYQPLWVDEGWSIAAAQQGTLIDVTEFVAADVHPPFYFQLLAIWQTVSGESIVALRYLSVLTVLLSAALVYKLGRGLVNPYAGALAAGLFLLHDLIGVLGREVRQYPLTQLLAVLVMLLYWRVWITPPADNRLRGRLAAFVIAGVALLYTHYWGGFLLLALGLHTLITQFGRLRAYIAAFALMGALFLPWVPVVLRQISGEADGGLGHALPANRAGFDILTFQLLGRPETLWLILLAVGAVGCYFHMREHTWALPYTLLRRYNPGLMPALAVLIPVGASFAISFAFPTLSFRALSMIVPAAMLLIALAVANFHTYERAVLTLIIIALSLSLTAARPAVRLPWPDVAAFVAHYTDDTDAILIETDFDTYAYDYYLRGQNPDATVLFTEVERRRTFDTFEAFTADLNTQLENVDGLWITRYSSDIDLLPTLEAAGWRRTASVFWDTEVGVPVETWRYDRPTDAELTTFGDALILRQGAAQIVPDGVAVSLLWSPTQNLVTNYTISVFLLDADGVLVAQNDSYPLGGRVETAGWSADSLYFDGHLLPTTDLPAGTYTAGVRVYTFTDETFSEIAVQAPSHCNGCDFYDLGTVEIGGGDD